MHETVLLQNPPQNVESYRSQWEALATKDKGLAEILKVVEKPDGHALVFSHDDPDGITSGLIFKRMLEKKGWKVSLKMPAGFLLSGKQLDEALVEVSKPKAIFLLDKGTLVNYSDFGKKFPVYIVDHHPTPKPPTDCVMFNPSLEKYTPCSTSILAHGIATLANTRDTLDDFLCLLGLKGDWAIEPVKGILVDFAKPFFVEFGQSFKNLFTLIKERPTMFDAEQREHTCLLSRISEFVHGVGGGGFQYFYNDREESLKNVDHPHLIATALEKLGTKSEALKEITSLESFVRLLEEPERSTLSKIFLYFLQDWEKASKLLDSATRAVKLDETTIYLFVGGKVPLLPMIGSIKLFDLKLVGKDPLAQIIMVSSVSSDYTHISVRGTGDRVHSGKFCGQMQDLLQKKYEKFKDCISGGGHPRAAECTIRTAEVPFITVMKHVIEQISEMADIDQKSKDSKQRKNLKKRAVELGLEYLNID
jgi:hypothetical protein